MLHREDRKQKGLGAVEGLVCARTDRRLRQPTLAVK